MCSNDSSTFRLLPREEKWEGKLGLNAQEFFLSMCHVYLGQFAVSITIDDLGVFGPICVFPWIERLINCAVSLISKWLSDHYSLLGILYTFWLLYTEKNSEMLPRNHKTSFDRATSANHKTKNKDICYASLLEGFKSRG